MINRTIVLVRALLICGALIALFLTVWPFGSSAVRAELPQDREMTIISCYRSGDGFCGYGFYCHWMGNECYWFDPYCFC
jgi:hypothetical protein